MSQNSCVIRDFSSTNSMRLYSHQKLQCGELTVALINADIISDDLPLGDTTLLISKKGPQQIFASLKHELGSNTR